MEQEVERQGSPLYSFNPHSRETPSGTYPCPVRWKSSRGFNPHSRETPSGTCATGSARRSRCFNPHSRETPSGTSSCKATIAGSAVSILTRGKPRVERTVCGSTLRPLVFQSSLEGNPEWNEGGELGEGEIAQFQSSLEGNPEWNDRHTARSGGPLVSILTRGKPRVEHVRGEFYLLTTVVSILTRGKPRVERCALSGSSRPPHWVSILTRGKPRVEPGDRV